MSSPTFAGRAYGLDIYSALFLPELLKAREGEAKGIILICRGETPEDLPNGKVCGAFCKATKDQFLLSFPGVGSFYVTPDRIIISPEIGAEDGMIRQILWGAAMTALLHMRGILALHASAFAIPDGTAGVIVGVSTSGKSTLVAALSLRGYGSLADDIVAVHFDENGTPWIYPGLARAKLWGNDLTLLGFSKDSDGVERIRSGMDKYYVPHSVHSSPLPLSRLYELSSKASGEPVMKPVIGKSRIEVLMSHTCQHQYMRALECEVEHMYRVLQLVPRAGLNRIIRPQTTNTLATIVGLLEQSWL